jgi:large subunit ribosomal protein L21
MPLPRAPQVTFKKDLSPGAARGSFHFFFKTPSTMAYAIIRTGSKQYRVSPGAIIEVEKLTGEAGAKVTFDDVVLHADGADVKTGTLLGAVKVTGEVLEQFKDKKVIAYKFRRRKGYHRTVGHRRRLTRVKIETIEV